MVDGFEELNRKISINMETLKSIIIIIISIGGIAFSLYDLITGRITEDPIIRRKVNIVLYIILILLGVSLIIKNIEILAG